MKTRTPKRPKAPPARPYKGQSLLAALDDFTVVDIETTGLSPRWSAIIELGAVKFRGGKPADEASLLINPGFDLPPAITELTGITDDMLWTAPPLIDVLPFFLDFVGGDVILGHNVNFDVNFLYDKALAIGLAPLSNDFVDTMRISRKLYPEHKHHRLCDLCQRFGVVPETAHRALADCYATAACYEYMKPYI